LPLARITFDSGLQSDPTFSPDGRFVAYSSDKAGNFDIWVQPVAGGDAVQVTKSTAHETQPAWSPDGSSIVFRSERDGGGLYIIPALGGVERRLTTFGLHPSWTVDGKTIRFLADRPPSLYSVAPPAESPRQILPEFTASGDWRWIGFHPDGRVSFLGFHKQRGYGFFTVSTAGDIVDSRIMMNAPTELANMKHSGGQRFHWMNDGRGLIFETENNSGVQNIWKVVIDPSTLGWMAFERLTSGSGADVDAAVSSDGGRLMFSNRQMSDRLWQFRLDDRHRLVDGQPFTQDYGVIFGMDISSDGRTAAFGGARLAEDPPTVDVWIAQLSSRRDQIVAKSALAPVWSADRRWLAYIRYKSDTTDPTKIDQPAAIAVRDTAGGPEQIITPWSSESWWEPSDWIGASRAVVACHGSHVVTWPVGQPAGIASSRQLFEVPSKNGELHQARVSPNGRWLSFVLRREGTQQIGVTTVVGPPNRGWTTIPTGSEWVDQARWSPDGTTLYYLVRTARDMFNVWGLSFDPESGRTNGPPFALTQYDSPALIVRDAGLTVLEHSAFLALHSSAGNIWMLDKLNR